MLDSTKARDQVTDIDNEGERRVGNLLLNMGFKLIGSHIIVLNSQLQIIGEIDLIFELEHTLFLVEVSTIAAIISSCKTMPLFCWQT